MKKLVVLAALVTATFTMSRFIAPAQAAPYIFQNQKWTKAPNVSWPGNDDNTWYKIDTKDATVYVSRNNKDWEAVSGNMFVDKNGRWIRPANGKLVWSEDSGATWSDVPDSKWQARDGQWYRLDSNWTLYVQSVK